MLMIAAFAAAGALAGSLAVECTVVPGIDDGQDGGRFALTLDEDGGAHGSLELFDGDYSLTLNGAATADFSDTVETLRFTGETPTNQAATGTFTAAYLDQTETESWLDFGTERVVLFCKLPPLGSNGDDPCLHHNCH